MKNQKLTAGLIALCALALSAPLASAAIVGVTGNATWLGIAPAGCGWGQLSGINAYAWDEQQARTLNLPVDMINNPGSSLAPIAGVANGVFDSHFLHFDGIPGVIGATGTVSFSSPIVAVIFTPTNLDISDAPAGSFGTAYPTLYPQRGLSVNPLSWITINSNILTFNLNTIVPSQFIDQVRILTQTPTPGTASLLGLAALGCARRRRH